MKKRIITGLIMALILVPLVIMPNPSEINDNPIYYVFFILFQLVCAIMATIAATEMINMFEVEKKMSKLSKYTTIILTLVTFLNVGGAWNHLMYLDIRLFDLGVNNLALLLFTVFALLAVFVMDKNFTGSEVGKALLTIAYVGFGVAGIVLLKAVGVRFVIYVLLITVCTDVFAYFFGISFGKHKMAPTISPKKTWEGAIGGTVMATLIAGTFALFYGYIFTPEGFLGDMLNPNGLKTIFDGFSSIGAEQYNVIRPIVIIFITVLGSVATQMGDLVASKFKRNYEIKDFGKIFPGHGGVLDRFDSLIFVSLLFVGVVLIIQNTFPMIQVGY